MAVRHQTPHRRSKEPKFGLVCRADFPQGMWGLMAPSMSWFFLVAEKPREAKIWQKRVAAVNQKL
jgi:hypothetical protein